jgi:hypothetical protein
VNNLRRIMLLASVAALMSTLAAACGGSSTKPANGATSVSQQSVDQLTARIQRDEMLHAWVAISNLPVHDLDVTLQGGKIDGKYVPTLRTLIRLLALTEFTPAVQPTATQLHDDAVSLFTAMNSGLEPAKLQTMSMTVHNEFDKFSPALGDEVAKDLPANAGGPGS